MRPLHGAQREGRLLGTGRGAPGAAFSAAEREQVGKGVAHTPPEPQQADHCLMVSPWKGVVGLLGVYRKHISDE